ncbi:Hypothetical_protein [Hexamita inflata]|uniref:Hypothetical_protein n=1 Tax=Hexamita inflata TaxID=28002 RepID=A0AA86TL74_9EUKA|nr:Hypothetical protein HINF_LOCUS9614 [Hexamita inflata]
MLRKVILPTQGRSTTLISSRYILIRQDELLFVFSLSLKLITKLHIQIFSGFCRLVNDDYYEYVDSQLYKINVSSMSCVQESFVSPFKYEPRFQFCQNANQILIQTDRQLFQVQDNQIQKILDIDNGDNLFLRNIDELYFIGENEITLVDSNLKIQQESTDFDGFQMVGHLYSDEKAVICSKDFFSVLNIPDMSTKKIISGNFSNCKPAAFENLLGACDQNGNFYLLEQDHFAPIPAFIPVMKDTHLSSNLKVKHSLGISGESFCQILNPSTILIRQDQFLVLFNTQTKQETKIQMSEYNKQPAAVYNNFYYEIRCENLYRFTLSGVRDLIGYVPLDLFNSSFIQLSEYLIILNNGYLYSLYLLNADLHQINPEPLQNSDNAMILVKSASEFQIVADKVQFIVNLNGFVQTIQTNLNGCNQSGLVFGHKILMTMGGAICVQDCLKNEGVEIYEGERLDGCGVDVSDQYVVICDQDGNLIVIETEVARECQNGKIDMYFEW